MTSKLKCPMCGHKLALESEHEDKLLESMYCPTCKHFMLGNYRIWQALIQAKQDLEIARKALKEIESTEWYDSMSSYEIMTFTAMKALETIGKHNE